MHYELTFALTLFDQLVLLHFQLKTNTVSAPQD